MNTSRSLAAVIIFAAALAIVPASWAAPKKHSGTITTNVDLSGYDPAGEAELWLPYPISDRDQKITDIKVSGDFVASAVYADSTFSTPMLYARWNKGATNRKLTFSFKAERSEVIRRDFPAVEGAWNRADFAQYLGATSLGPVDGEVGKLARAITAGKTTVLDKAKAIFDWTCENTYRDPKTRGCGAGDVCALLRQPGGKCADIHSVFIALSRAAGVPSREAFGIRMGKKDVEDVSTWQHCWAEFYLPGYGWVPVDAADVRKAMLTENLKLEDPKTKEYRAYFWGGIDPYRVKLAVGRDLTLNPPQPGGPVNYLMYPFARVGDKIIDSLDPSGFKYSIIYTAQ